MSIYKKYFDFRQRITLILLKTYITIIYNSFSFVHLKYYKKHVIREYTWLKIGRF